MISEEVQRRVASCYMENKMTEEQLNEFEGALIEAIWFSNEHISKDELVKIGGKLIKVFLVSDDKYCHKVDDAHRLYLQVGIFVVTLMALSDNLLGNRWQHSMSVSNN